MSKSSLTGWKTPWPLRLANLKIRWLLGAKMRLYEYTNEELIDAAQWASYCGDARFANYLMEEIVERVIQEHPPDGQELEIEFEEGSEEAEAAPESFRETDYDSDSNFIRRR